MKAEIKKEMGLEIGRAIHLNLPIDVPVNIRQTLYDEIMVIAENFADLAADDDETKELIPYCQCEVAIQDASIEYLSCKICGKPLQNN